MDKNESFVRYNWTIWVGYINLYFIYSNLEAMMELLKKNCEIIAYLIIILLESMEESSPFLYA